MTHGVLRSAGWLGLCACLALACVPRAARLRYFSFEKLDDATVEATAKVDVDNLLFGSSIPVEYRLQRASYEIRIKVNPKSPLPVATIEVRAPDGTRIAPRPRVNMRSGRTRPCGSFDQAVDSPQAFEFSWVVCGGDVDPGELTLAFDVLDSAGAVVAEERLPFEVERDGVYWYSDSL